MGDLEFPDEIKKKAVLSSLQRGVLLVWDGYKFQDGQVRKKMVLLLSDCISGTHYAVALPTSKTMPYIEGRRSFQDTVCFVAGEVDCFYRDTVIDLKNLDRVSVDDLASALGKEVRFSQHELPTSVMDKILDQVRIAKTLTPQEKKAILGE